MIFFCSDQRKLSNFYYLIYWCYSTLNMFQTILRNNFLTLPRKDTQWIVTSQGIGVFNPNVCHSVEANNNVLEYLVIVQNCSNRFGIMLLRSDASSLKLVFFWCTALYVSCVRIWFVLVQYFVNNTSVKYDKLLQLNLTKKFFSILAFISKRLVLQTPYWYRT